MSQLRVPVLILLGGIFVVVNAINAIHKGGDFDVYVQAGGRLLAGNDLYAGSDITVGFVGPPAQAVPFVLFVPISAVDARAARLVWYALNLLLLWYALSAWTRLLTGGGLAALAAKGGGDSRDVFLSLLGVAFPLQTQFEHQNVNVVLLALGACAADALRQERHAPAGIALGAAAALKVYPALALLWLVARRSWRTLGVALTATFVFTLMPILFRGAMGFLEDVQAFRGVTAAGWPARPANQSVVAMWGRYLLEDGAEGFPIVTSDAVGVLALSIAVVGVLLALILAPVARRGSDGDPAVELAEVSAAAALVSPIAWEHYFVAWFPVLLALRVSARRGASRAASWAFWIGVLLLTGLSRATLGPQGGLFVRTLSLSTVGALVTCGTLAFLLARRQPAAPPPGDAEADEGRRGPHRAFTRKDIE